MARRRSPSERDCSPECGGICCTYFALEIDAPVDQTTEDHIRWYLLHERVSVYVEDGVWHLLIDTPCRALDSRGQCSRYEDRPLICREHDPRTCEYHRPMRFDQLFESVEEFDANRVNQDPIRPRKRRDPAPPGGRTGTRCRSQRQGAARKTQAPGPPASKD